MRVVITGGSGFLGQVLAREVLARGRLRSGPDDAPVAVTRLVLADLAEPRYLFDLPSLAASSGVRLSVMTGDVSDASYCASLVAPGGEGGEGEGDDDALSIFHLGAVMSGAPPDLALKVNLHGTVNMLEAARSWREAGGGRRGRPTFVFSSAGATLGSGHPADWVGKGDTIADSTRAAPHTTYGTTKACAELLLADYSRREFVDGRGVRLPSVVVRAGAPNAATTGCFSGVVREPLSGAEAVLPVGPDVCHAVTGYRAAVGGMLAVHDAPSRVVDDLLGYDRTVFLPTRSVSLRQLEEGMRNVVEPDSAARLGRIVYEEDETLSSVVGSFPTKVDSGRAVALGAPPTPSVEDMIREYCEDFPDAIADGVRLVPRKPDEAFDPAAKRVVAVITGAGSGIGRAVAVRLGGGGLGRGRRAGERAGRREATGVARPGGETARPAGRDERPVFRVRRRRPRRAHGRHVRRRRGQPDRNGEEELRPDRPPLQQRRDQHPPRVGRDDRAGRLPQGHRDERHGRLENGQVGHVCNVYAGVPEGGTDNKQRLGQRPLPPAGQRAVHGVEARCPRPHEEPGPRRPVDGRDRRPDRLRQRLVRHDERGRRERVQHGIGNAPGGRVGEARADVRRGRRGGDRLGDGVAAAGRERA
ncbi:hypothetical protein THAOC_21521 [Thalassiosira oceanica]|uniref:NAD-dependent epimerase/dehydratase domain-containing protein n=1 Tax=Thalassiosira oceanica TaxID=159749 RepID=K0S0W3_THAOC|nr:hypothetical protein THAOC_21521 [Thalassiosira oceanica]|eukprot:EJK58364.1 hypothetical protein THAOC_21521 [Thalassiosira oceanica]